MLLALLATLALADASPRYMTRECLRGPGGRSTRGVPCAPSYAYFELAPASGAGMGAACACTNVTGAKGEAASWTRGSSAYCTKEGLASSGITTTSMVLCGSNLPRAEADNAGVLGVRAEAAKTNNLLRSEEFENAAWTSTATVTADTTTSPANALTADTLSDVSGVAVQSSCQTVALGPARYRASVYVRSGTLSAMTLRMTGTGDATGDCSVSNGSLATTYSRVGCGGLYSGALTAVTVCVDVGAAAADTGTVIVWGAQLEATSVQASSYIATTGATATRSLDGPVQLSGVTLTTLAASGSAAASVSPMTTGAPVAGLVIMGGTGRALYANTSIRMFDGTTEPVLANGLTLGVAERYWSSWTGSTQTLTNVTDSTQTTGAFDGTMDVTGPLQVVADTVVGTGGDWIVSRICLDPSPARCR